MLPRPDTESRQAMRMAAASLAQHVGVAPACRALGVSRAVSDRLLCWVSCGKGRNDTPSAEAILRVPSQQSLNTPPYKENCSLKQSLIVQRSDQTQGLRRLVFVTTGEGNRGTRIVTCFPFGGRRTVRQGICVRSGAVSPFD